MDIQALTNFLMWCTIINGAMFLYAAIIFMVAPDFIYRMQSKLYPIPREKFDIVFYAFLGVYKILFLTFNLVPYIALCIIG